LRDRANQPLDLAKWLRQLKRGTHSRNAWCEYEGKEYHVRIIVSALPPEKAAEARKRKEQEARRHGRKIQEDTLLFAGWVLFLTTLPKRPWSYKWVLQLYRARWQVELLFKRMKQVMQLHTIRAKTPKSSESSLLAWLVAWALQENEAKEAKQILHQAYQEMEAISSAVEHSQGELSLWLLTAICVQTVRQTVQGYCTRERRNLCLPHLQRFLRGSPRKRRLQSHQACALLDQIAPVSSS
jgi:hypothetical protein